MKKKRYFSVLAVVLAGACLFVGCAGGSKGNQTLPEYSKKDVVYRAAWWCPKPTQENYKLYQECNLNALLLANHNYMAEHEDFWERDDRLDIVKDEAYYIGRPEGYEGENATDKALALAKDMGLYVFVADGNGYFNWIGEDVNVYDDFTFDYDEYKDQIVGLFAGDEPSEPGIADVAARVEDAREKFPNIPYFSNLFPYYADLETQIQCGSYQQYIDTYCEEMFAKQETERLISVDYYPFQGNNYIYWLHNYRIVQDAALKYGADIHYFIQACIGDQANFEPITENDIRLQVNVALAYGAKQYSYYVYDVPLGGSYQSGLVDEDGKPVDMYQYAKVVNTEVASLENAFAHYNAVKTMLVTDDDMDYSIGAFSVIGKKDMEEELASSNILHAVTTDNRGLVTLLQDEEGNEAFYLVNYYDKGDTEIEEDCTFTLQLDGMKQVALYGSRDCHAGESQALDNSTYTCTLAPGDGILVVPYKK